MTPEVWLTIGMFGGLIFAIICGVSLGFAMGGVAVIAALTLYGVHGLLPIVTSVFNYMWMLLLAAIPLFVFIGVALAKSSISHDLYHAIYLWSGRLRGGLAIGSCIFSALLSAMTGNCSASTVTAGLVSMPPMIKKNYDQAIVFGTIGASGTLGILIPPSITLILIGMASGQSIGKLFAGGLAAGLVILFGFIGYILVRSYMNPSLCPIPDIAVSWTEKFKALKSVTFPLIIILAIIGTIFLGVATPTEAASVGAVAVILAIILRGEFNWEFIRNTSYDTGRLTGMVMWILFGAGGFVAIYSGSGGIYFIQQLLHAMDASPAMVVIVMQLVVLVLGMFLDPVGIIILCMPIFYPVVAELGVDPIWFGILFQINLCIGYLSPPFGYNLFYLKTLNPDVGMKLIYVSVLPFISVMLACEILMYFVPEIITYLPGVLVK